MKIERRYRLDVGCAIYLGTIGKQDYVILRFILPYGRQRNVLQALRCRRDIPTAVTLFVGGKPAVYMKYVELVSEDWRIQFSKLHADETVEVLLACDEARVYDVPLPSYEDLPPANWPIVRTPIRNGVVITEEQIVSMRTFVKEQDAILKAAAEEATKEGK